MVKNYFIKKILLFLVIFITLSSIPFILWYDEKPKYLNTIILDKTVPNKDYREHRGLVWILNNLKYFNKDTKKALDSAKDYYGFFPLKNGKYEVKDLQEDIAGVDLIYLADTYGVYSQDFNKNNARGERSEILYGGTTKKDVDIIKRNLNNNLIIGEFNILNSPTAEPVREELEDIFGIRWTGWIGRYFYDLSKENTEIPNWLINNYEKQYNDSWNFKKEGFAFVNEDDTVFVLTKEDLGKGFCKIDFLEDYSKEFKVKDNTNYYYWFEVMERDTTSKVIANYIIDVNDRGMEKLERFGLKSEFPAIINKESNYTSYYFAGDYADINKVPKIYNSTLLYFLNKITTMERSNSEDYFYWNVYYPLMKNIMEKQFSK